MSFGTGLTSERLEVFKFLASLYPNGRTFDDIKDEVSKQYSLTNQMLTNTVEATLNDYKKNAKIIGESKINDKRTIILTDKGKDFIWSVMNEIWKTNKTNFFAYLKRWEKLNDKTAIEVYRKKSISVLIEKPIISCMLLTPIFEHDLITHYSRIIGKDVDNALISDVSAFLGRMIGVKFVSSNEEVINNNKMTVYFLNKEGRQAMMLMFNYMKGMIENKISLITTESKNNNKKMMFLATIISFAIIMISWSASTVITYDALLLMMSCCFLPFIMFVLITFFIKFMKRMHVIK